MEMENTDQTTARTRIVAHLLADVVLQEDLLHLAGDHGGVQLAGQGRHLVQAGAR